MPDQRLANVPVKEGAEYDVSIQSIGQKGDGIAKVEGYNIIIPGAKIDEKLRIRITRTLPNYAFAERV